MENINTEEYKDIPGFDGQYVINDKGTVVSVSRLVKAKNGYRAVPQKVVTPYADKKTGNMKIQLFNEGKKYTRNIDKLLKELFGGNKSGS